LCCANGRKEKEKDMFLDEIGKSFTSFVMASKHNFLLLQYQNEKCFPVSTAMNQAHCFDDDGYELLIRHEKIPFIFSREVSSLSKILQVKATKDDEQLIVF
jgi:hypothetical protein